MTCPPGVSAKGVFSESPWVESLKTSFGGWLGSRICPMLGSEIDLLLKWLNGDRWIIEIKRNLSPKLSADSNASAQT